MPSENHPMDSEFPQHWHNGSGQRNSDHSKSIGRFSCKVEDGRSYKTIYCISAKLKITFFAYCKCLVSKNISSVSDGWSGEGGTCLFTTGSTTCLVNHTSGKYQPISWEKSFTSPKILCGNTNQ